jgi:hypothetical protein
MAKYRRKPVVVDAVQLTRRITIYEPEGKVDVPSGNWLITDPALDGGQYICKDEIFQKTYEPVEAE